MPDSSLHRFLLSLHRRHVLVGISEKTGLGLTVGLICAATILLATSSPVMSITAAGIGLLAGFVTGWFRRPSPLDTAIEADRQLHLHDLLSSAWTTSNVTNQPWAATLRSVAEARCAAINPSAVRFARLTGRAWGSLGLIAILFTVLVPLIESRKSHAAAPAPDLATALKGQKCLLPSPHRSSSLASDFHLPARSSRDPEDAIQNSATVTTSTPAQSGQLAANQTAAANSREGTIGHGTARTPSFPQNLHLENLAQGDTNLSRDPPGSRTSSSNAGTKSSGFLNRPASTAGVVPTQDARSTQAAIDSNTTSPAVINAALTRPALAPYRDLIRAYFDRE